MNRFWKITGIIVGILAIGLAWFLYTPVDIRPEYLKENNISEADKIKGKALLQEMQEAYGGMDNWLAFKTGRYAQTADWYENKMGIAGWDTLPQQFEMTSTLGTDNAEFTLLNGQNKGQTWGVEDWKSYQKIGDQKKFIPNEKYHHKLIYKNYWFQFPFRISEAPIIAYAGEDKVDGETYDLLYATWGSETPNREYDQYVLYVDKATKMIEWLHFTLRDKVNFIHITASFTHFKNINGITLPFSQYITVGHPTDRSWKMHENHYQWIKFDSVRVMR